MEFKIDIIKAGSAKDIREGVFEALKGYEDIFSLHKKPKILIKPNLNANMNALTGNTTDLRLLAGTINCLKDRGLNDITIGEGTNSGYYRNNISVISRLKVSELASYYGVKVIDLNQSVPVHIDFENGVKAGVASECLDADLIINMPKLKTHFEVGMSVCLKNLIGCLVGQENKKKTHKALTENILCLNNNIKPHLHIVDGLIAMEGLGPTRGKPKNMGLIVIGTDPFLIDMVAAKIAQFDYQLITTLKLAEHKGLITEEYHDFLRRLDVSSLTSQFERPKANPFAAFVHSPKRQKYFLALRNTSLFTALASTGFFGRFLFLTGLRQDNFIMDEMVCEGLYFDGSRCKDGCNKCSDYCPLGLTLPEQIEENGNKCIKCLYCFLVCPTEAIGFKGNFGFMDDQLRQYDKITREIA